MSEHIDNNSTHSLSADDKRYATLGKLTSGMLHDMVNPLTALAFRLELIEQEKDVPKQVLEQLKMAQKDIDAVKGFIEATKRQIPSEPEVGLFSPVKELGLISNMLAFKMREGNISLRILGDETIETYGDAACFYDAFFGMLLTLCDAILDRKTGQKNITIEVGLQNDSISFTIKQSVISLKSYLHGIEVLAKHCDATIREVGEGNYTTTIVMPQRLQR